MTCPRLAGCRNYTFYSFADLKITLAEKLKDFNHEAFQKREGSRYEVWLKEKQYLRDLPSVPYEGVTSSMIEIHYYKGEKIATHHKFPDYATDRYLTHLEDIPKAFRDIVDWDDECIRNWAKSIGKYTCVVNVRIFGSVTIKEQGYNPCLAVLRLSRTYSDARLETAYELALARGIRSPHYRHLKAILSANQDIVYKE